VEAKCKDVNLSANPKEFIHLSAPRSARIWIRSSPHLSSHPRIVRNWVLSRQTRWNLSVLHLWFCN